MATRPKRPRDTNQLAHLVIAIATGETEDVSPTAGKNIDAARRGRLGGAKGGNARAAALNAEQRREIARNAAKRRWRNVKTKI